MKKIFSIAALLALTGAGCASTPSRTAVAPMTQVADVCVFFPQADVDAKLGRGYTGTSATWGQFAACDFDHATRPETFSVRVLKTADAKSAYADFKREQTAIRGDKGHVKNASGTGTEAFWSFDVTDIAFATRKNGKTLDGPKDSADFYAYKDGTLVWIESHSDTLASEAAFPDIAAFFAQRALEKS